MKKKSIIMILCLVLAILCLVGSTLAYFTDTEKATNTFTVGSVDIQLLESQLYRQVDGSTDAEIEADAAIYHSEYLAKEGENLVPGHRVNKCVYVKNTGKNDAYIRVRFQWSRDVDDIISLGINSTYTGNYFNDGMETAYALDIRYYTAEGAATVVSDPNWAYTELVYTYRDVLEPGKMTEFAPLWWFSIDYQFDNEDLIKLYGVDQIITVYADAIQADLATGGATQTKITNAYDAFNLFDKQEGYPAVDGTPDQTDTKFVVSGDE